MQTLPSAAIDAGVLAVPSVGCPREDAYRYVETLLHWRKLLDAPWITVYMSERASETLLSEDLYPLRNHLQELFRQHGIIEFSINDVARVVEGLLSLTPSFESYYRVSDVLTEHMETEPDVIRLTAEAGLQSDLARCITLIAILRRHCAQQVGNLSLVLKRAPKQIIRVRAQIHEIDHARADVSNVPPPPEYFEGDVLACDDFRGLIDCLDEAAIFVGASDNLGIELAIRIALFKDAFSLGHSPEWEEIVTPSVGSSFRKLCQQCCADQADSLPRKILRSIVETANGHNLSAVHALRIGMGGGDPQRLRGADRAQRRDIDREFHLHYWNCQDGTIELGSVVYHNDFSIPE